MNSMETTTSGILRFRCAIEASYGGVVGDGSSYDDLKALINDAHSRGISVIGDVVFNHLGTVEDSGPLWNL